MKVKVNRKAHFNAAHRLHNPVWSEEKNRRIFGKCNNPNYHGHNYELIVSITGDVNPDTGYVIDMKVLQDLITERVEHYFDHKNLNLEVVEFKELNPTAEHIASLIWHRIKPYVDPNHLLEITLYETPQNFVTYDGN